jgi:hypothetical protein
LHNLLDGLPQDNAGATHFSLAEVIASCLEVIVLDLSVFEGELPSGTLMCKVMAVGVFVPSSIRTGVWHLVVEVSVVAGHVAPPRSLGRAKMMGRLAVGGEMIEPWAVGAATVFLILILHQSVIPCVVAHPRDGTSCSSSQTYSPMLVVRALLSAMSSVLPCQFPSLAILVYQLQEAFPGICSYKVLAYRFGAPDVR